ncbi:MAG: type I restriction endonuclease subunit R [Phascolarctobacterium sp.]|uniref:type I restriction endonuclease subunit R n=1 Tax=Phascolarctobacterium sp. TaxID=2049039 RepID=UPI0026DD8CB0|nr:type I restriction endonuclease subunit R [Phascolarctobacterium sp.]MDO4920837.1 type I restriction endonuclease subunit R [Phascolarctobacterium sp.]
MSSYNIVLATNESTVVAAYEPQSARSDAYQSEAALEAAFIKMLGEQGYEYAALHSEQDLIANLRRQLELLNNYRFTDKEWQSFFQNKIANANEGVVEKTRKIQEDYVQNLTREDGTTFNIALIDKKNIHNNRLQVINQYAVGTSEGARYDNRYDVTILVNGLPLVHVELKRRGVAIKEAFNQINRYQRDSFWAGCGLYEYVQVFVISNGTFTKYYSNTTRANHIKENENGGQRRGRKTSNSFEFTSYWADGNNKVIADLVDFTKTFFAKHTLLNILTKYCVFTTENLLLVMRPYQIVATERILNRIEIAANYKKLGSVEAGGYIWHTTGSGKTLTSFKAAQLASALPYIDKVMFVVDRKDLDYQTIKEYERFAKGCVTPNKSTAVLQRQLEDTDEKGFYKEYPIIVTTIQKLSIFIAKNPHHPIRDKRVALIFDECHRSQFGDMHARIVGGQIRKGEKTIKVEKYFKHYCIFGFTGTPIFAANAGTGGNPNLKTTEQAFGAKLHTYTIVDAINDGNVLPFRIDFINTVKQKDGRQDKQVAAIDTEAALNSPERIGAVVQYILEHFDQKTVRGAYYSLKGQRVNGFNSIFAVSSIAACKKYYGEIKKQLAERRRNLTVATIFSFAPNEEENADGVLADESFDVDGLDASSRDFLEAAIADYNKVFHTNFNTSAKEFENYYKDLSQRVKNREVDLLIVVNMFLTGFDATTLNTLWVDKNLKMHGLVQAFSRTNRILNSVKTFGNIVCFRDLEQATDDAIALFGDKEASGIVLLKSYDDYYYGYKDADGVEQKGYEQRIAELQERFPLGEAIIGEQNKKDFLVLFGNILRLRNILAAFDRFAGNEILSPLDFQDYTGTYHDIYEAMKRNKGDKDSIIDDVVFEMELVKQVEVNIDYILLLVAKYHASNCRDKEILVAIDKAIKSSLQLRSKRELIENFIATVNASTNVKDDWQNFVQERCASDMQALIAEERLKPEETQRFVQNAFRDGVLKTTGTEVDRLLPPVSRFGGGSRDKKKQTVLQKLQTFFEKYFGLANFSEAAQEPQKQSAYAEAAVLLKAADVKEQYGSRQD